jgi:hypothetical protein
MAYDVQESAVCLQHAHKRCKGTCVHNGGLRPCLCGCHINAIQIPLAIAHLYTNHPLSAAEANKRVMEAYDLGLQVDPRCTPEERLREIGQDVCVYCGCSLPVGMIATCCKSPSGACARRGEDES